MRVDTVAIDALLPYPGNPRHGDVGAISESLRLFGQTKPIVVQASTSTIVAGNHLWRAAKALGWRTIEVVWVDMDDATAKRYLVADNRTQELGSYDDVALATLLTELAAQDALEGTGYDGEDVDDLLARTTPPVGTGRGQARNKPGICVFEGCEESGERFNLKLPVLVDGEPHSRGAGSIVLCESHWLAYAQPAMTRPVMTFEALKRRPLGEGEDDDD